MPAALSWELQPSPMPPVILRGTVTLNRPAPAPPRRSLLTPSASAILTLAVLTLCFGCRALAQSGRVVRLNQLGYLGSGAKRAFLLTPGHDSGATFTVRDEHGRVRYRARAGKSSGRWGRFIVQPLDFDPVTQAGTYTVQVEGRQPTTSPPFRIASGTERYQTAIARALKYFQAVRDGPDFLPSALRSAPAHLHDLHARVYEPPQFDRHGRLRGDLRPTGEFRDAAGGWWDAGDYLKFVETASYSVVVLLAGVRDFPRQMGAQAGAADFTAEARFGVDWLLKMWDDRHRTLYYQVGLGAGNERTVGDHDLFRLPQADDGMGGADSAHRYIRHRPVFRAGPPRSPISPNLAGRLTAVFALAAQVFARQPEYAQRCLVAAEHIYALADTTPRGRLLTTSPYRFYDEHQWRDDLELGATELALALRARPAAGDGGEPQAYLRQAAHWAHLYIHDARRGPDTLSLDNVAGLAHYEIYRALPATASEALETSRPELLADLRDELDDAENKGRRDPFGFGVGWAADDPVSHGAGLAVMASEYAALTGKAHYQRLADRWLGNLLGANAWGVSFIIGDGTVFPNCPQHQLANLAGSLNGQPPILLGAAVEGPSQASHGDGLSGMRPCDASARFTPFNADHVIYDDRVQSFNTNEPGIDLTATTPLAMAWVMAAPHP